MESHARDNGISGVVVKRDNRAQCKSTNDKRKLNAYRWLTVSRSKKKQVNLKLWTHAVTKQCLVKWCALAVVHADVDVDVLHFL